MQTDMRERSKKEGSCEKISNRARTNNPKKGLDQKKKRKANTHLSHSEQSGALENTVSGKHTTVDVNSGRFRFGY